MTPLRAWPPVPRLLGAAPYTPGYWDFAFLVKDPEGMWPRPPGYHGGADMFAPGGEPVLCCVGGEVVERRESRGNTGQIFGGTLKVRDAAGRVWAYRHIDPIASYGATARAGGLIARVTAWRGGPSHLHLEIWGTLGGGYNIANAINPKGVLWTEREEEPEPPPHADSLRLVLTTAGGVRRSWAGWDAGKGAVAWVAVHGLAPTTSAAIAWRGSADVVNLWRGPGKVVAVCRAIAGRYL